MTSRWVNFFQRYGALEPNWLQPAVEHWGFHSSLYGNIRRFCPPPARILDVGCGPGWSTMFLSSMGYSTVGIDNDPTLIEAALTQARRLDSKAKFEHGDAFDLSRFYGNFDVAFSCGVLEHFDRDVTVHLLTEQAKCARYVIIQIPTGFTRYTGSITDERIYNIFQLRSIVQDSGLQVVSHFGYGDLVATQTHRLLWRMLPRGIWRLLQNYGYAYCIAVIGASRN